MNKELKKIPWIDPKESPKNISVRTGDVYQFATSVSTRAGHYFEVGDLLVVQFRTQGAPYGEIGPRGYNWQCLTRYSSSVWSTLESSIERGLLKLVHRARE